jgi:nuclear cap-binding protein subunit 1
LWFFFETFETLTFFSRVDDLDLPIVHPKMAFIHGALDKEIRLSFAQRIKGTLPEAYQSFISEGKEKDTPEFKYLAESK